ncbi:hypothetical protein C8J57DRAFT_1240652 [Mycena rebaudengoi]|nr:hypothetical protein C8J57DRAFT_1240652 [Mycena rebaudengoi]
MTECRDPNTHRLKMLSLHEGAVDHAAKAANKHYCEAHRAELAQDQRTRCSRYICWTRTKRIEFDAQPTYTSVFMERYGEDAWYLAYEKRHGEVSWIEIEQAHGWPEGCQSAKALSLKHHLWQIQTGYRLAMQPEWRTRMKGGIGDHFEREEYPQAGNAVNWRWLRCPGPNGVLSLVASLYWWGGLGNLKCKREKLSGLTVIPLFDPVRSNTKKRLFQGPKKAKIRPESGPGAPLKWWFCPVFQGSGYSQVMMRVNVSEVHPGVHLGVYTQWYTLGCTSGGHAESFPFSSTFQNLEKVFFSLYLKGAQKGVLFTALSGQKDPVLGVGEMLRNGM